jgi:flagellin-like protein
MKGISAIIATVLLVAFAVAIAGIVSVWSTTLTTSQTKTIGNQSKGQTVCTASITIDQAKIYNNSNVTVTYHNIGNQVITNIKVFATSNLGINSTSAPNLGAGEMNITTVNITGNVYLIRATGTCASSIIVSDECEPSDYCWKTG